jgi:disulfide bond formation protein DsbB
MYPLSIVLGIAAYHQDTRLKRYVLPLSIIGGLISLFHYLQQKVPGFAAIRPCAEGVPCHIAYINWFGFITIPFLALVAFVLITLFMLMTKDR